jgi:pSer/pThr/pTyr-binding forkhead associated (FHA) protein
VISWNGARWEIVDLGSSNGTTLNGVELAEEGAPVPLADGDTLVIGTDTTATVKIAKAEAPKAASPAKPAKVAKKAAATKVGLYTLDSVIYP